MWSRLPLFARHGIVFAICLALPVTVVAIDGDYHRGWVIKSIGIAVALYVGYIWARAFGPNYF